MKSEYKIRDGTAADIPAINELFNGAGQSIRLVAHNPFSDAISSPGRYPRLGQAKTYGYESKPIDVSCAHLSAEFHTEWFSRLNGYPFVVVTNSEEDVLADGALEPQSTAEGSSFMFNTNLRIVVKAEYR